MRVLLTGASGQLGAYLIGRLRGAGHEVSAWSGSKGGTRLGVAVRPVDRTDPGATERAVLAVAGAVVARLSLLFGASRSGVPTYLDRTLDALRRGEPQTFFEDEFRTPLDLDTAAGALAGLLASDASGLVHVAGRERL